MKTSHLLVAGAIGISAIALLKSSKKLTKITDTTSSTDDDLLQWKGDPSQVSYEIPEGLVYNGETLRDFCGSFWSIRDHSPESRFLNELPDAIRKYSEVECCDISSDADIVRSNIEEMTENLRIEVIKAWIQNGSTHDTIMNWMNGDFDVSKISSNMVSELLHVAQDALPKQVRAFFK